VPSEDDLLKGTEDVPAPPASTFPQSRSLPAGAAGWLGACGAEGPEELLEQVAPDDPAATAFEFDATRRPLALIAQLPADQTEVVMLRVVAVLDVAKVAQIVGNRPRTIHVLSHHELRRLAALSTMPRT
jgi:DNA-directed RNA polymerase specialized sigma24 family protein